MRKILHIVLALLPLAVFSMPVAINVAYDGYGFHLRCSVNYEPQVLPIVIGFGKLTSNNPTVIHAKGTVSLVRSKGRTILFDTGSIGQLMDVTQGLMRSNCGRIDMVVISHGHPDHFENRMLAKEAPSFFGGYNVNGLVFSGTPMMEGGRFFLFNDPNLEIISTPGHTKKSDISLIVRNVPGKGTVALCGDVFLHQNDETEFAFFFPRRSGPN